MSFCSKCGAYIAEGSNVCPACGKRVGESAEAEYSSRYGGASATQAQREDSSGHRTSGGEYSYKYTERYTESRTRDARERREDRSYERAYYRRSDNRSEDDFRRTTTTTYRNAYDDSRPNIALLSYFGILFIVPYLLRPDSEYVRFHANQGLLLLLCSVVSSAVASITIFGWLASMIGWIFTIVCFFKGINNVLHHRFRELPIIGKYRLLK